MSLFKSTRFILTCVLFLAAGSVGSPRLWAQFTSGFEGTVSDPTGAVIPGATVTIKNEETGVAQASQTTQSGSFRFTELPSATFAISASAPGFKTTIQDHVHLEVSENRTVNLSLQVGGTDTVVNVTGDGSAVETSQARVSGEVDESQLHSLPLVGRNFYNLATLTPESAVSQAPEARPMPKPSETSSIQSTASI